MGLLKAEICKLFYDKKIKVIFFLVTLYLLYSFFIAETSLNRTFEEWVVSGTTDSIIMNFLFGIVAATIFTIDYANVTYKNFLPYSKKFNVFISKIIVNVIGVFLFLSFWYVLVLIFSAILTEKIDWNVTFPFMCRFFIQYLMVLFHSGLIIIIGTFTRNGAVANGFTIASWLLYSFIPVNGKLFYDFIVAGYAWKKPFDITLAIIFVSWYAIACFVGFIIFSRQEE